jgi:DNA-binding NtrC family response regulator
MFNTVYVLERDEDECRWIEAVLAGEVRTLVFLQSGATLLDWLAAHGGDCLLCSAEPDADAALELVRSLRRNGQALPVLMIGPHSAFRTAVDVARLSSTDFLPRPLSAQRLRAALRRVTGNADPHRTRRAG